MDHPKRKLLTPAEILADPNRPQLQPAIGWTIYDSHWQVDSYWPDGTHKEKIAYTNFFFAAEAAYNAALVQLPNDRLRFGNRMRTIKRNYQD